MCAGTLGWQEEEKAVRPRGARVTRGCELMGWELNLDPYCRAIFQLWFCCCCIRWKQDFTLSSSVA